MVRCAVIKVLFKLKLSSSVIIDECSEQNTKKETNHKTRNANNNCIHYLFNLHSRLLPFLPLARVPVLVPDEVCPALYRSNP